LNLARHYEVLGLPPGSSLTAIKRAYLREIKIWHPDRYSPASVLREQAEERTKALTAAYAALLQVLKTSESHKGTVSSAAAQQARRKTHPGAGDDPWLGRVWRRLKNRWQGSHAAAKPKRGPHPRSDQRPRTSTPPHTPKSAQGDPLRRRVSPPFEEVLQTARGRFGPPEAKSAAWRRLTTRRARYLHRRKASGSRTIEPIEPRGPVRPVSPVRRIRPIGEDD
jgi:curved DNA-binding protein CbpA